MIQRQTTVVKLHGDFETRSTLDLKKVGILNYVTHPTTGIWCFGWAINDGPVRIWRPGMPLDPELYAALEDPEVIFAGHHVSFEWHVIQYICSIRYGWPTVDPTRLDDTAARAAAQSLPRDLAGALKSRNMWVEKDEEGRRLMLRMSKPRKIHDDGTIEWWDVPERRERLEQYCATDVEGERALDNDLLPLSDSERKIWLMDFHINGRGVAIDIDLVRDADKVLRHSLIDYSRRIYDLTGGEVPTISNHSALRTWLASMDVVTDSVGKEAVTNMLKLDTLPDLVREVLKIRQQAAKSSTAKLKRFMQRVSDDGRMRDNVMYHGAGTGRWTAVGVQLHNLPRPTFKRHDIRLAIEIIKDPELSVEAKVEQIEFLIGPVPTVISDCLRGMIVAGPGRQLDVSDFANIEGRVNAHRAGQEDKVALFRDPKGKIYERMASAIYGIPVDEIDKDSIERFVGKETELGCGFGMGWQKFKASCAKKGVDIVDDLAQRIVTTYREVNRKIKNFWYGLEDAAVEAMRFPGTVTEYRGIQYLLPTADMDGHGFLLCRLPSGRCLFYPSPELRKGKTPWGKIKDEITFMGVHPKTKKWCRQKTYGGMLVENVVQAIARDLLAAAMYRVQKAGYDIILTVHDEIVSESVIGFGSHAEFKELMAKVPKWAEGCPIAVEGFREARYRK
jgi:DNA polymerase